MYLLKLISKILNSSFNNHFKFLSNVKEKYLNSTTGVLTATIFKYALGAGITADAGTRVALQ